MTETLPERRSALIVGAGIAGTAAALALRRAGWRVRLCEQAEAISEVGAGLQISPNGVKALRALGIDEALVARAVAPAAAVMRDGRSGFEILRMPLTDRARARWGAPYLHLHRADLLDLLLDAARAAGVELCTGVAASRETTGGLVLSDGGRAGAELTVIASGAKGLSKRDPRFTGQVAWRALVPAMALPEGLIAREATVWVGPGRHLVTYQLRGGTLINLVAVEERADWAEESWSAAGDPGELRTAFAGWHPDLECLLRSVETCYLWGLFDRPVPPALHAGTEVLIGDAAHPMLPFMAQGATMALEDAVVLATCVSDPDIEAGLARFTQLRRARVARVQEVSRRNARLFHMSGSLPRLAAYAPIAAASRLMPGLAAGRFDWLYGHDVRGIR